MACELWEIQIHSRALRERRTLTVYLPPARQERPPVLYLADGGSVPRFASVLEPAIVASTTPAAVLVGVHSAVSTPGDDVRAREYLPGIDRRRYAAHETFFVDEVTAWAERELGVSAERHQRAAGGYSNGAVLASALGCRYPDASPPWSRSRWASSRRCPDVLGRATTYWPAPWSKGFTPRLAPGRRSCATGA